MTENGLAVDEDFAFLTAFLPEGWRGMAKELGALRRCRKIRDADTLLRILLIHLAEGLSLRETAALARQGGLADLSDVAVMDRLERSGEWFRWMNGEIAGRWAAPPAAASAPRWRVRLVDGTYIKEPGPTGSSWRLHYSIALPSLACDELRVCPHRGGGESFERFSARPGELLVADRAYGVRPGVFHAARGGGDVLVRFALSNLPLQRGDGQPFDLLGRLRGLRGAAPGDWPAWVERGGDRIAGRVCAVRKSRQAAERARAKVEAYARKEGAEPKAATLESAGYVFVFTTADRGALGARDALEMYRGRWQVELVFKRLKSVLGLGHMRKTGEAAGFAWIHGKLFVALMVELLLRGAEAFFPWGYPLGGAPGAEPVPVEGGEIHAASDQGGHPSPD